MSDNKRTDYGDAALIVCATVLIVLFYGEPDIADAIRSAIAAAGDRA